MSTPTSEASKALNTFFKKESAMASGPPQTEFPGSRFGSVIRAHDHKHLSSCCPWRIRTHAQFRDPIASAFRTRMNRRGCGSLKPAGEQRSLQRKLPIGNGDAHHGLLCQGFMRNLWVQPVETKPLAIDVLN